MRKKGTFEHLCLFELNRLDLGMNFRKLKNIYSIGLCRREYLINQINSKTLPEVFAMSPLELIS